jgi:ABC-type Zn uptake system ZnuABC Zn-binding protein ZnuA
MNFFTALQIGGENFSMRVTNSVNSLLVLVCFVGAGCSAPQTNTTPQFVATIPPLAAILSELTAGVAPVTSILSPGASPHTYEAKPSDAQLTETALALFYVSEDIDGWAADLPSARKIGVGEWVPEAMRLKYHTDVLVDVHDPTHAGSAPGHEKEATHGSDDTHHAHEHGAYDFHFWSDPLTVLAMLPQFTKTLQALDPAHEGVYLENAGRFAQRLQALHEEIEAKMQPVEGQPVVLFHQSWAYFLARYRIPLVGLLESAPGKELGPQSLARLQEHIKAKQVKAIFSEPQLPQRPAQLLAEATGARLAELDPLGGQAGRTGYMELIRYNAAVIAEALK